MSNDARKPSISMVEHDIRRWGELLLVGTQCSLEIRQGNAQAVRNLVSIASELYSQWRTIMPEDLKAKIESSLIKFNKIIAYNTDGDIIPTSPLIDAAMSAWQYILDAKQEVIGVPHMSQPVTGDPKEFGVK